MKQVQVQSPRSWKEEKEEDGEDEEEEKEKNKKKKGVIRQTIATTFH